MKKSIFLFTAIALTASLAAGQQVTITAPMRSIVAKTESFGLNRYPISFWSYTNIGEHGQYMTEAEVASWADAGFTVPQSPGFDVNNKHQKKQIGQLLDWANKYGMKLIVTDPRGYAKAGKDDHPANGYTDGIRAAVKDFGTYPALFGFHVGDEPDSAHKKIFFESYRIQKEVAPNLHPFANLLPYFPGIEKRAGTDTWPNYLDEYARNTNADMVGYDYYAHMNPGEDGWTGYYKNLKFHREAALRNGIPFWTTNLSVGHFRYRIPNLDEIRWQFNTTIASGANGIVWFFYYMRQPHANYRMSPVDEFWNKTPLYYDLQRVQNSFHKRYKDLFNKLVSTRVCFYGKSYGDGEWFSPDDLITAIGTIRGKKGNINDDKPLLIGEFVNMKGQRYVMFVNNSMTESNRFIITFPGNATTYSFDWYGNEYAGPAYCSDEIITEKDGTQLHGLWLAPGQEALYRVEIIKQDK
jgi:hypothetical protein